MGRRAEDACLVVHWFSTGTCFREACSVFQKLPSAPSACVKSKVDKNSGAQEERETLKAWLISYRVRSCLDGLVGQTAQVITATASNGESGCLCLACHRCLLELDVCQSLALSLCSNPFSETGRSWEVFFCVV